MHYETSQHLDGRRDVLSGLRLPRIVCDSATDCWS